MGDQPHGYRISEVGLLSPALRAEYQTRMNAVGTVYVKGRKNYLYEEDVYYGADVKEGENWGIPVSKRFVYPSFDAAVNNLETVRMGFSVGVVEIAKRMSEQIHAALK